MPRYIRQRDRHSCGPICLLNICKFQGKKVTYRDDLLAWKRFCNCGSYYDGTGTKNGTTVRAFHRVCRELGGRRMRSPNMRKMHQKLEEGFALAIQVRYTRDNGHHFLIDRTRRNAFRCINLYRGETAGWTTKKRFYREQRKHTLAFRVWVIPKE